MTYRFALYDKLRQKRSALLAEARRLAKDLGTRDHKSPLELRAREAPWLETAAPPDPLSATPLALRQLLKQHYGDAYDGALVASDGQWLRYLLGSPGRCLVPYEKDMPYLAFCDGVFPPAYELGPRRISPLGDRLEAVVVPLAGAQYDGHGLNFQPTPILLAVQPGPSCDAMAEKAADHAGTLTGVITSGADTVGYGFGVKHERGVPLLATYLAQLARELDLPYVMDNRLGLPLMGTNPAQVGAHAMLFSSPLPGTDFLVAQEDLLYTLKKRGQASLPPEGAQAVVHQLQLLTEESEGRRQTLDELYELVTDQVRRLAHPLAQHVRVTKSANWAAVEVNYEATWSHGGWGWPLFSGEDDVLGDNLLAAALTECNITPPRSRGGNLILVPPRPRPASESMRLSVRGLFSVLELLARYSEDAG